MGVGGLYNRKGVKGGDKASRGTQTYVQSESTHWGLVRPDWLVTNSRVREVVLTKEIRGPPHVYVT